ncbi:diguanylate cyclase [Coleofasciculus sp. FACHB-129]|uniref:GGDEF domain-containing protein n=2 Tax=Cyanophyceae TaxID=3028117 RepID=UPI003220669F
MVEILTFRQQGKSLDSSGIPTLMDAFVLVVGTDAFLATFLTRIAALVGGAVEAASQLDEVIPLLEKRLPYILILQASLEGSLEFCYQLKQHNQLAGIYCILIEDRPELAHEQTLSDRHRKLALMAEALEKGADAYLQIAPVRRRSAALAQEEIGLQDRLLAAQIQMGLRKVQNYRQLMRTNDLLSTMALSDPLTELNNRRALEWELPRQIQNARSRSIPLSLVMLDVDFFKSINDTYGHLIGDRVLQLLSARLQHNLRFQDTLFRYGGEEFVVILSHTDVQEAPVVAHRLCRLICEQPFRINPTLSLTITISLGTGTLNATDDIKGVNLLQRADQNLLQAKSDGRNRVVSE